MNIENMIQGNPQALVKSVNGIMVADSLQVADSFGKQHSHVLRAIESLITSLSTEEAAVNDEEWMYKKIAGNSQSNFGLAGNYFIPDTYADKQGKERVCKPYQCSYSPRRILKNFFYPRYRIPGVRKSAIFPTI